MRGLWESRGIRSAFKFILTCAALWWLYRQIDWAQVLPLLRRADWGLILAAFVLYNVSQVISARRLQSHLAPVPIQDGFPFLLKLYYRSMFFNLFLPGGIGGDGYKVWMLRQRHRTRYKTLISATLLDRGSGLLAIVLLLVLLAGQSNWVADRIRAGVFIDTGLVLLTVAGGWAIYRFVFPTFRSAFVPTLVLSLLIQGAQVGAILLLLRSVGVSDAWLEYALVFLFSSLASVLPLTVGGIGIREFVFLSAAAYLPILPEHAVLATLLFFLVNAVSSLLGAAIDLPAQPKGEDPD